MGSWDAYESKPLLSDGRHITATANIIEKLTSSHACVNCNTAALVKKMFTHEKIYKSTHHLLHPVPLPGPSNQPQMIWRSKAKKTQMKINIRSAVFLLELQSLQQFRWYVLKEKIIEIIRNWITNKPIVIHNWSYISNLCVWRNSLKIRIVDDIAR